MANSIHGMPVHGRGQGTQVSARLDNTPVASGSRSACLTVDMTIDPGLYVYGQPVPEGFIPLSIDLPPLAGLVVGTPVFPPPKPYQMEGLDDVLFIYEGGLSVAIPLTFAAAGDDMTLAVQVRYQACSDRGCFMPQTVELHLPVRR